MKRGMDFHGVYLEPNFINFYARAHVTTSAKLRSLFPEDTQNNLHHKTPVLKSRLGNRLRGPHKELM